MSERRGWPECMAFAAFVALLLLGMHQHVIWRDEAEAWLIVRDSADVPTLLHNMRYTGHPALFYVLMMPFQAALHSVVALQALQFITTCALTALLLWGSPFTQFERLLLPFGAFTLFEYGVKSRSYALGFVLLCLACLVVQRRPRRPIVLGMTLALLANVHVLFAILAAALAGAALPDYVAALRGVARDQRISFAAGMVGGAVVFAGGMSVAAAVAAPPADSTVGHDATGRTPLFEVLRTLLSLSGLVGPQHMLLAPLGIAVLALLLWALRGSGTALRYVALGAAALLLFFGFVYPQVSHHCGLFFCLMISALWIARTEPERPSEHHAGERLLAPVLVLQAVFGLAMLGREFRQPYSNSYAAASYLRAQGWDREPVAALADFRAQPVLAYLNVPRFYYVPGHRWGSFVIHDRARYGPHTDAKGDTTDFAAGDLDLPCPFTLLTDRPLPEASAARFGLREAARFEGAVTDENYVLYRRDCD
jgi:hypothetical protein